MWKCSLQWQDRAFLLLQDGTPSLPCTSLLQRTLPQEEEDRDKSSPWSTRYKSMSPTFKGDVIWMGPTSQFSSQVTSQTNALYTAPETH